MRGNTKSQALVARLLSGRLYCDYGTLVIKRGFKTPIVCLSIFNSLSII
jgi:hypothetical protein